MEEVIDILIDDNINIDTIGSLSQNRITVKHLIDEYLQNGSYILNKNCDYLAGFYAYEECIFNFRLKNNDGSEVIFYYKLEPNKVFYALDNKFMIPCLQLYDCNILVKLIKGNPSCISLLRINLDSRDKYSKNTLFYCKIKVNYYIYYIHGRYFLEKAYKYLIDYYNKLKTIKLRKLVNIQIYKFIINEDLSSHILNYIED